MSFPLRQRPPLAWILLLLTLAILPLRAQVMDVAEPGVEAVRVESASIGVEVTGRLAVTTYELVFRNPNPRQLEGTLLLPLLDGQTVIGFALDLNGVLRDAVPVDKARARVVFEEIERRSIDPGLLEKTAGNVHRVRVYPLPPGGTRRVRIQVQEDLKPAADETVYRLNLNFPQRLARFHLSLNVHAGPGAVPRARTTLNLQLPTWRDAQHMELERLDFEAKGLLEISLPKAERPRVMTGRFQEREYFYAEVPVLPMLVSRPAPKTIGLIWDSSGSGSSRNHARELALLDSWFSELKSVEVRLVRLRDRALRDKVFSIRGGDWATLRRELENTSYDGATSLDGLAEDPRVDTWILFSDGCLNYGAAPAATTLGVKGVVHTVASAPQSDAIWLQAVARSHGGEYVDLVAQEPAAGAYALQAQSMRLLGLESSPEEVSEVYPEVGSVIRGDSFVVAGVLRKPNARVRVLVGQSRENAVTVDVPLLSGGDLTPLAARAWAVLKLQQLAATADANRADIRRTSRDFGIATEQTSLLVLETVDDYVLHEIEPPAELRAEWEARRHATQRRGPAATQHREEILRLFQDRVAWWNKAFPRDKPKGGVKEAAGRAEREAQERRHSERPPHPALLEDGSEVVELHAFEVAAGPEGGYRAGNVIAGSRLRDTAANSAEDADVESPKSGPEITLSPWNPDAGYLDRLARARPERRYQVYLEERHDHAREPGFFLDVADRFFSWGDPAAALTVLSNLAELELDDPSLLRVLGHRLLQAERADLALPLFERVLRLREEEPQSRRDLALACAELGQFQRAVDLLWQIASQPWDSRFPAIELIALNEMNAIIATCGKALDLTAIDPRFVQNLPVDLRVVLTWDANDCDIDLWVDDPNQQTAKYDFPLTHQGGLMSKDFTGGYGPEEFLLKSAKPGRYLTRINYYGDRRQNAFGPVTAQIRLITHFGTAQQQEKRITLRLKATQETVEAGKIDIPAQGRR